MLHVIHELERLERRVAALAARAELLARRRVERGHEWRRRGALEERVDAAAIERVAFVLLVFARVAADESDRLPDVRRLIRVHAFAAHLRIEQAAHEQRIVADLLRIEAEARAARQQAILRVALPQRGRGLRGLPERRRGYEHAHERLHVPARFAEGDGEPVEQLGVARRFALRAEVARGFHESDAEDLLPESVHSHPGGEGMRVGDEPAGEVEARGLRRIRERRQRGGHIARHLLAGFVVLPAQHDEALPRLLHVAHDERGRDRCVENLALFFQRRDLLVHRLERRLRRRAHIRQIVIPELLLVLGFPVLAGHRLEDLVQLLRKLRAVLALARLLPCELRLRWIRRRVLPPRDARLVPIDRAAELRVGQPRDLVAGLEPQLLRLHLQPHPLARIRQRPSVELLRRARLAPLDRPVVAPYCAVLPAAFIKLQHDRLRHVARIEEHVREELARRRHLQRRRASFVEILRQPFVRALQRARAAEDLAIRRRRELRRLAGARRDLRARGEIIIEPHLLDFLRRRPRLDRAGVRIHGLRQRRRDPRLHVLRLRVELREPRLLLRRRELQRRFREQRIAIHRGVRRAVEERVELVKLPLRDRIELVVVADRALRREAHPRIRRRRCAIQRIEEDVFRIDRPALARRHIAPVEPTRHELRLRRIRQQIAGELLDRELIEPLVVVERLDDPIAVGPHRALVVEVKAVRVPIPRLIQPRTRHLLAVARRRQQPVDHPLIRVRCLIRNERLHFLGSRRQTGECEAHAPDHRLRVRFG